MTISLGTLDMWLALSYRVDVALCTPPDQALHSAPMAYVVRADVLSLTIKTIS